MIKACLAIVSLVVALLSNGDSLLGDCVNCPRCSEEQGKLRGTWDVVSAVFDGKATPEDVVKQRQMIITDDQLIAVVSGEKKRPLTITLDPAHSPKHIDLKRPQTDDLAHGIYQLSGDELKLCYGEPGAERPTEFASKEGAKTYLLVLKRSKVKELTQTRPPRGGAR